MRQGQFKKNLKRFIPIIIPIVIIVSYQNCRKTSNFKTTWSGPSELAPSPTPFLGAKTLDQALDDFPDCPVTDGKLVFSETECRIKSSEYIWESPIIYQPKSLGRVFVSISVRYLTTSSVSCSIYNFANYDEAELGESSEDYTRQPDRNLGDGVLPTVVSSLIPIGNMSTVERFIRFGAPIRPLFKVLNRDTACSLKDALVKINLGDSEPPTATPSPSPSPSPKPVTPDPATPTGTPFPTPSQIGPPSNPTLSLADCPVFTDDSRFRFVNIFSIGNSTENRPPCKIVNVDGNYKDYAVKVPATHTPSPAQVFPIVYIPVSANPEGCVVRVRVYDTYPYEMIYSPNEYNFGGIKYRQYYALDRYELLKAGEWSYVSLSIGPSACRANALFLTQYH